MKMDEAGIITRYFLRETDPSLREGIGDDAAVIELSSSQLVVTTDSLVSGVHFESDRDADAIGHKALAVNLSDMAAMGATPHWALLALTLPSANDAWLSAFAAGFFRLAERYQVDLIGGDTTLGPLTITLSLLGACVGGRYLSRRGARVGDGIYVTGRVADVALLALHAEQLHHYPEAYDDSQRRTMYPEARVRAGEILTHYASAAIDVSDGILKDLNQLLTASAVGAELRIDDIPVAPLVDELCPTIETRLEVLSYGDDYELLFIMQDDRLDDLTRELAALNTAVTRIGIVRQENDLCCTWQGKKIDLPRSLGYDHFAQQ